MPSGHLYASPARSAAEARTRCQRLCRLIAKLRGHGLIARVPRSRLYRVTPSGQRAMAAALHYRRVDFVEAFSAAA